MQSSGFINRPDPRNILNMQHDDDMMRALESVGAMNAAPALRRSSHLKNKNTGVVLPWNPLLAEQRDIMVNCDAAGNTDPEAWEPSVIEAEYTDDERDMDYWEARNTVVQEAMRLHTTYRRDPHETSIPIATRKVPDDVMPLEEYYDSLEKQVAQLNKELDF